MKVIELLNKIANGENLPNKVKLECVNSINEHNCFYEFNPIVETYVNGDNQLIQNATCFATLLNLEVEIIEKDKKIPEKIDQNDRQWHYLYNAKKTTEEVADNLEHLRQKVNKIIDYLEENK